jgi:GDPmannose 4,6-dehydratase
MKKALHTSGARFILHHADLHDASRPAFPREEIRPDEIYNLDAQSRVKVGFEVPEYTSDVVALGALRMLEAVRRTGMRYRI